MMKKIAGKAVLELEKLLYGNKITNNTLDDVLYFCKNAGMVRTPENCASYFQGKYDSKTCKIAMQILIEKRLMGAYTFASNADPHPYMQKYILDTIPGITADSTIMEVGPGNHPLFSEKEYPNWYGCDLNYKDGKIAFSNQEWGKGLYKKIYNGSWDNLAAVCSENNLPDNFDIICGCHSFEHTYKPITALKQAAQILRGGHLVLFVPDGYSTWPGNYDKTHTLYMVPDMVNDFFYYADCFVNITCKQFRANMDMVITARKKE
jgi:SAM-dependent methyltransferase